jgi:hypothetical protein
LSRPSIPVPNPVCEESYWAQQEHPMCPEQRAQRKLVDGGRPASPRGVDGLGPPSRASHKHRQSAVDGVDSQSTLEISPRLQASNSFRRAGEWPEAGDDARLGYGDSDDNGHRLAGEETSQGRCARDDMRRGRTIRGNACGRRRR